MSLGRRIEKPVEWEDREPLLLHRPSTGGIRVTLMWGHQRVPRVEGLKFLLFLGSTATPPIRRPIGKPGKVVPLLYPVIFIICLGLG